LATRTSERRPISPATSESSKRAGLKGMAAGESRAAARS
jgi:hypothetical protein